MGITIIYYMNTKKIALTKTKQLMLKSNNVLSNNVLKNFGSTQLTEASSKIPKCYSSGSFIPNSSHKFVPVYIDDETWWVPDTSGIISKGRFQGYYYDAKNKIIKNGEKTILKI